MLLSTALRPEMSSSFLAFFSNPLSSYALRNGFDAIIAANHVLDNFRL